jgi:hypothetical protein
VRRRVAIKKALIAGLLIVAVLLPATAQARHKPHVGSGQIITKARVHDGDGWMR